MEQILIDRDFYLLTQYMRWWIDQRMPVSVNRQIAVHAAHGYIPSNRTAAELPSFEQWKKVYQKPMFSKEYLNWVKQAHLEPLTNNQVRIAEWLLESKQMDTVGEFSDIFKSVKKYKRH